MREPRASPLPSTTLTPLYADADRVLVGAGLAFRFPLLGLAIVGIEAGYQAQVWLDRTASNPDFPAAYSGLGHIINVALTARLPELGGRLKTLVGVRLDAALDERGQRRRQLRIDGVERRWRTGQTPLQFLVGAFA